MRVEPVSGAPALLEPVQSVVEAVLAGGDPALAATPDTAAALHGLAAVADLDGDLQVAQVLGLGYFLRSVAVSDLDEQARCFVQALVRLRPVVAGRGVVPDTVMEVYQANPRWLTAEWRPALAVDAENLGSSAVDDPVGLSIAIALLRETLSLAPEIGRSHAPPDAGRLRFESLTNLGMFLRLRSELTGSVPDLEEALIVADRCLADPSATDQDRPSLELNASLAHRDRSRVTDAPADLAGWLLHAREAVRRSGAGDPRHPTLVNNLVAAMRGNPDVDDAGEVLDEVLEATDGISAAELDRSGLGVNRAAALITRYERDHRAHDLDEAIGLLHGLVEPPAEDFPDLAGCLSSLAVALMMRYDLHEVDSDLQEGLAAARAAVQRADPTDPDLPMYRSNLSLLELTWGQSRDRRPNLGPAVDAAREALAATPAEDERYAAHAANLATTLVERTAAAARPDSSQTDEFQPDESRLADLAEAASLAEMAARLREGRPDAGHYLAVTVTVARGRYHATRSPSDLDALLERCEESLKALPPGDPSRAGVLIALAEAADVRRAEGDLARCAAAAREAAECPGAPQAQRLGAAYGWAKAAEELGDWLSACRAYEVVRDVIEIAVSSSAARSDQEQAASHAAGLPSRAAAAHLMAGDPEGAASAFEGCHAVLFARRLGSSVEQHALARLHPDLAKEYADLRARLASLDGVSARAELGLGDLLEQGRQREQSAALLTGLLARIRALDGSASFAGGGAPLPALYVAARSCPVVLLSVAAARSDALLITPSGIELVPLPDVTQNVVIEKAMQFWGAVDDAMRDFTGLGTPVFAEHLILDTLAWLWDAVAEPVLAALGLVGPPAPGEACPVICWCPSGFLSLLPIHAAGHHETRKDPCPRTVLDRVVSTYTPTVGALLRSGPGPAEVGDEGVVIAVPVTPGAPDLPGALTEAETLEGLAGGRVRLLGVDDGSPATLEAVLGALPSARWAHFACHAMSDLDSPSRSRLLLAEGEAAPLSVADLMALDLHGPELAYLSACATGRPGPALLDEVVHLASAFMLAGYPHVVGTLWPIGDRSAAFVAERFYRELLRAGPQQVTFDSAAYALHEAVRALRDLAVDRPSKWSAHVHLGGLGPAPRLTRPPAP